MQQIPLETDRLLLRRPVASDLEPYTSYCLDERSQFVGGPYNTVQAFEKLAAMIGHWELRGFGRLILVQPRSGQAIGHVGAMQLFIDEVPEMTWTLWSGDDEGQGYATEACKAYLDHARDTLGIKAMIARIEKDNLASRALAERLGGVLNAQTPSPKWMADAVTYDFTL